MNTTASSAGSAPGEASRAQASAPGASSTTPLRHLIYTSTSSTVGDAAAFTDILHAARTHNANNGLTGVLIYFDRHFLQYLEGPPAALEATLQRIRADPRHHNLLTMADEASERRLFSKWTMGIIDLDSEAWDRLISADWPHVPGPQEALAGAVVLRELAALHHDPDPVLAAAVAHRREALAVERLTLKLLKMQMFLLPILILLVAYLIFIGVQS